jgi:hypothetical protein
MLDIRRDCYIYIVGPHAIDEKTQKRNKLISRSLSTAGFCNVQMVRGAYLPSDPVIGCSLSHAIAIQQAMKRAGPFLLLENDTLLQQTHSFKLELPHNADAVYLGISSAGLVLNASKPIHCWHGNFYSNSNIANLVRIYNMLSTHAILILTDRFARNWQTCCVEAVLRNVPIDVVVARTLKHFNIYAQRKPWFYQAEILGGQEKYTRVEFDGTLIKSADELPVPLASFATPCIAADLAAL